jgi:hypothetical protein
MNSVTVWVLAAIVVLVSVSSSANEIYITQSGDDLDLRVEQRSKDNYVSLSSTGNTNDISITQGMHYDGSSYWTDTDETGGHEAYWTVTGANNTVWSSQTDTNRGGGGGSPHHLTNIVNGDNNAVAHTQMGKTGHDGFVEIQGDNNDVTLYQRGNGGAKWADIVLTGDGHAVDINQRGSNSANATVDLTNSGGAYDFTLSQNVTTSADSYSMTGYCYTASGCTVNVNRNN